MDNLEEWRDISGYEGYYQASDLGQIKSLERIVPYKISSFLPIKERILRPSLDGGPTNERRLTVGLCKDKQQSTKKVHQLVLETFVGPRPEGFDGCHNDGNPLNNRLDNLRWDTKKNNQHDRLLHGTDNRGERGGLAKLTEAQVLEIRSLAGLFFQKDLGKRFGVSQGTIAKIITRKTWRNI